MERGSILAIIATKFPAAISEALDLPDGEYWSELPDGPQKCPRCGGRCISLVRVSNFNPLTGVAIYCSPERRLTKLVDCSHDLITETQNIARAFVSSCDTTSMRQISLDEARTRGLAARPNQTRASVTTKPVNLDPLVASVPVPDGYRNVAWLRTHEAQAITMAYERRATVPVKTSSGKEVFRAEYVASSKDATKAKANVKAMRVREGRRDQDLGWIRELEAKTVLEAHTEKQSIQREDSDLEIGVLVQFFESGSLEERTFKSCTRLLRKL